MGRLPSGIRAGAVIKHVAVNTYNSSTPDASDSATSDPDTYNQATSPQPRNAVESSEFRSGLSGSQAVSRTEFFYDCATTTGNLTAKTDARGVSTSFSYDALNRVTSKSYSDSTPSVSYFYDTSQPASIPVGFSRDASTGRLTAVTSAAAANFYGYDALGQLVQSFQRTDSTDYGFSYAYNRAGAVTSETYPSGRVVSHSYDSAGRIASVSGVKGATSTTYTSSFAYAPHGARSVRCCWATG